MHSSACGRASLPREIAQILGVGISNRWPIPYGERSRSWLESAMHKRKDSAGDISAGSHILDAMLVMALDGETEQP